MDSTCSQIPRTFCSAIVTRTTTSKTKFSGNCLGTNTSRYAHTSSLSIEPLGSNGIDLINEDNRRGILSGQSEYVPYHTRPLTQIFLHKFWTYHTNKRSWRKREQWFSASTNNAMLNIDLKRDRIIQQDRHPARKWCWSICNYPSSYNSYLSTVVAQQ